jgi:4'-phosphopantetheinyl transferase
VQDQERHEVFDILRAAEVEVVGTGLDVPEPDRAALWPLLSAEEHQIANRYRSDRDRAHFVVARGRLRQLLAYRLRTEPAAVDLVATDHGKLKLGPAHARCALQFNLSHSGSLAVYAFAPGRAVGVDVEEVRDIPDAERLATRFFSKTEVEALRAVAADRRSLAFLACWTRKEAFVKAIGEGLSHPLDSFDVTIAPEGAARILRVGERTGDRLGWSMEGFQPRPGYIGAVVYSDDR